MSLGKDFCHDSVYVVGKISHHHFENFGHTLSPSAKFLGFRLEGSGLWKPNRMGNAKCLARLVGQTPLNHIRTISYRTTSLVADLLN